MGKTVDRGRGADVVLETAGAETERLGMNPFQSVPAPAQRPEHRLHPLHARVLRSSSSSCRTPTTSPASWARSRCILAFIGFGSLPLNIAGLLLIGLAVILFVLEFTVTSGGLLTIGGLVAFALGASALYTEPGDPTAPEVSRGSQSSSSS